MEKLKVNFLTLFQELHLNQEKKQKEKICPKKEEFYVQNFIISPNSRFVVILEKEKILQKTHDSKKSQLKIVDISLNEISKILKNINLSQAIFTFDSKYLILLTQLRIVTIINMENQQSNSLEFKSEYLASIDQNYNIYSIENGRYIKKYSINSNTLIHYNQIFELVHFQSIIHFEKLKKEFILVITNQCNYLLSYSNFKKVRQFKESFMMSKNQEIIIFKDFIKVVIIEMDKIDILLENVCSGKKIRKIQQAEGIKGNILKNQESIYFFGYQRIYDENSIIQFKLFDLIKGTRIKFIQNFRATFTDVYEIFKMKNDLVVGVKKYEEILRFFLSSSI